MLHDEVTAVLQVLIDDGVRRLSHGLFHHSLVGSSGVVEHVVVDGERAGEGVEHDQLGRKSGGRQYEAVAVKVDRWRIRPVDAVCSCVFERKNRVKEKVSIWQLKAGRSEGSGFLRRRGKKGLGQHEPFLQVLEVVSRDVLVGETHAVKEILPETRRAVANEVGMGPFQGQSGLNVAELTDESQRVISGQFKPSRILLGGNGCHGSELDVQKNNYTENILFAVSVLFEIRTATKNNRERFQDSSKNTL